MVADTLRHVDSFHHTRRKITCTTSTAAAGGWVAWRGARCVGSEVVPLWPLVFRPRPALAVLIITFSGSARHGAKLNPKLVIILMSLLVIRGCFLPLPSPLTPHPQSSPLLLHPSTLYAVVFNFYPQPHPLYSIFTRNLKVLFQVFLVAPLF